MKNFISWEIDKNNIKQTPLEAMDKLAQQESTHIKNEDIKKSKYIIKEAWAYYPWAEALLKKAEIIIQKPIRGITADIGAGTGIIAALLSKRPQVESVFAIEYSSEYVKSIMPITFNNLKAETNKIIGVIGSFNNIKVPDEYFDFICEANSLHHSENLDITLKELYRVLRPKGYIIALDRGHQNWVSEKYLEKILSVQMTDEQKEIYGLPKNFTRKMWGEHEYRYKDWKSIFARNKFKAYTFNFSSKNLKMLQPLLKTIYEIFGDTMLKFKIQSIPYYRWFFPHFKGPNMLLIAQKM